MEEKLTSPQTTLAIVLGASEWPRFFDFPGSEAFLHSANELKTYLLDSAQFGLPLENLLDLFDTEENASDIDEHISEFLSQRIAAMRTVGKAATDLLVYYVGHGGFDSIGSDYYLAIRRTRQEHPSGSGLRMLSLAHTLKENARHLRRILILDSCFSAAASRAFQGAAAQAAVQQTISAFKTSGTGQGVPSRGTTLLCSSGSTIPSVISRNGSYTMFTHGLLQALKTGVPGAQKQLSLREVFHLTIDVLQNMPDEEGTPNPELHSPDQREGDVANIPFFPNLATRALSYNKINKNDSPLEDVKIAKTQSKRQKQRTLDKVEKLVPGVDLSLYQDTFGKPTFINPKSFFMNPNDEMRRFVEYVFVDTYFYLDVIADPEGKILYFAVTIRDKSFNPTFKNQVFQVKLGISKYSDIPYKPRSAQGCYGANWFAYYETKYFGRPGAYEDFGFGFNSAGYYTESSVRAYRGLLSTTHNCHGTLSDQEIASVKDFSADEVFNTYAVSAPGIRITDYAHIILGVNYDQVRILNS